MASIWKINLFERDKLNKKAICKECRAQREDPKRFTVNLPSFTTTAAINHLRQYHQGSEFLLNYDNFEKAKAGASSTKLIENFMQQPSGGLTALDKKVINFIACTATSFKSLNHPTTRALMKTSNENLKDESHYRKKVLPLAYDLVKAKYIAELRNAEWFTMTSDIWTTSTDSFISLTAHFIKKDWVYCSRVLSISQFPGNHTAENINTKIADLIGQWKISREKIHVILRDGGTNFVKALRDGSYDSINCAAHILNLVVRDSLKDTSASRLLKKASKIVTHFKHSGSARDAFKEIQIEQDLPIHMLLQDMVVRWGAAFKMLERLLEQCVAIYNYCYQKEQVNFNFTDPEWMIVEDFVELLSPIDELSLLFCKDLASSQYPFAKLTIKQLKTIEVKTEIATRVQRALCHGLNERFGKLLENKSVLMAMFLDPRFKETMHPHPEAYLNKIQEWIRGHFTGDQTSDTLVDENDNLGPPKIKRKLLDLFEESLQNTKQKTNDSISEEIANYRNIPRMAINSDPISFWKDHETTLPQLSSLAKRYLSAQATTLASESVFSTARSIYSYDRMRIRAEKAEKLIFLNRALPVIDYSY